MSLLPNQLVATNGSSVPVSCPVYNSDGCNFSVATGGGTLNATMTQDLSTSGNPQFINFISTGQVVADATTDASSTTTGAIITAGGAGIAGNVTVGGQTNCTDTTNSTSATTGSIVTAGGLGVGGNIYFGAINFNGSDLRGYVAQRPWKPYVLIGGFADGISYTNQTGTWVIIGGVALCSFSINLSSKGIHTGNLTLTLPTYSGSSVQPSIPIGAWGLFALNTGCTQASLTIESSSAVAVLNQSLNTSSSFLNMNAGNLTNSSGLWGNFWFYL